MNDYFLGHATDELDRLVAQARFFGDLTEYALRRAGLAEGSRVLDVGCGTGDVSFLAARLVGPEGSVLGLDRAPEAVATARSRADGARLTTVSFTVGDVHDDALDLGGPFDAVIGRFVLKYLPDAAEVLRALASRVSPGGLVLFQEMNMSGMTSEPTCPLFDAMTVRVLETFARMQVSPRAGLRLPAIFHAAGLSNAETVQMSRVDGGPDSPVYAALTGIVRTLLPAMEQLGVATAAEVDVDTLEKRLRVEIADLGASVVPPPLVAVWARVK
jgi:2-polyprenyl-3-methyl-5-hydroxy-6-metoxy-1,4-benzoquinol methylase